MKFWKCNNCARETVTDDRIVSVVCLCGEYCSLIEKEEEEDERDKSC